NPCNVAVEDNGPSSVTAPSRTKYVAVTSVIGYVQLLLDVPATVARIPTLKPSVIRFPVDNVSLLLEFVNVNVLPPAAVITAVSGTAGRYVVKLVALHTND